MSLLSLLSSEAGDKTQESNERVAALCLDNPEALADIAAGLLAVKKPKLIADCAEVMTKVAEKDARLVVPYAEELFGLLGHRATKVRWEAAHALALAACLIPARVLSSLAGLRELVSSDASTIVRDYTIDMIANAAKAGAEEARQALPALREALLVCEGKHRGRVLEGLVPLTAVAPDIAGELADIAGAYTGDSKAAVQKAAKKLAKACGAVGVAPRQE
ncbi:hypothetical protein [Paenibacillus soyae]|uniref:HEAT repeat domain-containing protein n=1 Tax=Paenibacillus soyae TaxID=2969249 RepID=A0A9X2SAQ5_9BACL|nr:hypothetical protein [Paenibacillus soyae]MCR2806959.1 hypothetical protein [Paenibacillus soyae]